MLQPSSGKAHGLCGEILFQNKRTTKQKIETKTNTDGQLRLNFPYYPMNMIS